MQRKKEIKHGMIKYPYIFQEVHEHHHVNEFSLTFIFRKEGQEEEKRRDCRTFSLSLRASNFIWISSIGHLSSDETQEKLEELQSLKRTRRQGAKTNL